MLQHKESDNNLALRKEKERIMTYREVIKIGDSYLLPIISELYELDGYKINLVKAHDGGRNVVYNTRR